MGCLLSDDISSHALQGTTLKFRLQILWCSERAAGSGDSLTDMLECARCTMREL